MHLNITANSFVLVCINRGIAPTTFCVKLLGRELLKCVWISWKTVSFLYAQVVIMHPEFFSSTSQSKNFKNVPELHGKQLRFWTHKSQKCTQNFFYKAFMARTNSKMRLNFIANRFIFEHTNRWIVPKTFSVKLAGKERPKCACTWQQTASFLDT